MSGPVLDSSFTALPYRALGDAALARASELGPHIAVLGELCAEVLPRGEDDVNELPDEVMA